MSSSTNHTPIGTPRLVSKLCVVGEASEEEGDGASFLLFIKLAVPPASGTYPLFPDEHVQLRSSSLAPLSSSGSLPLHPSPPVLILEAAKRLSILTSSSISSPASLPRHPKVQVSIQDFAVCLVVDGGAGDGEGAGSLGWSSSQRMGSLGGSASGRRSSFSPTFGGDQESSVFLLVLEVAVPCSTIPPLDCFSISLPLPRCLSNTLRFHLNPSPTSSFDGYCNIATTPRLLTSPEVPAEELALEGTFQSTPTLEIRWALVPDASSSSLSVAGARSKTVTVRKTSPTISYTVLEPSSKAGTAMEVELDFAASIKGVHFTGVESAVHMDLLLDLPLSQSFEWINPPLVKTNVGLISFEFLDPTAPSQDDPDVSTSSTIHSPPSPSPSTTATSYLSQQSRPNAASTSQLSLLRQQLPSMNDTSDLSFAFDQSGSPSSGTSPSMRHRSPLSRSDTATAPSTRNARRIRLHLEISKIHQHRIHEPFSLSLRGSLRLGQQQHAPGEVILPLITILGEEASINCLVKMNSSAVPQTEVLPPQSSEPVPEASSARLGGGAASTSEDRWILRLRPSSELQQGISDGTDHFKLVLPTPPSPAALPSTSTTSNRFGSIKARRQSTASSFYPAQNLFSGSAAGDLHSRGWDQGQAVEAGSESQSGEVGARVETILKVKVEVVLVPRRPSPSSEADVVSSKKGKTKEKSTAPVAWDQLTKMHVLLAPRDSLGEEEDMFEFGVLATGSSSPPSLRVLSASIDSRAVAFEIQEREDAEEEPDAPGVVGYVRLFGEEGMRERGGEVEVCFVLDGEEETPAVVGGRRKSAGGNQGKRVVLGLPSFAAAVGWEEIKVSVGGDYHLTSLHSSSITTSAPTGSSIATLSHSLPALHAPNQRVLLLPSPPLTSSSSRRTSSFFSLSNLPLILLSFLLLSMGTEVRTLRSGLVDMVVSLSTEGLAMREAVDRCDVAMQQLAASRPPAPAHLQSPATSVGAEGNTILLPSFTNVPPPPPPSSSHLPASHQQRQQQQTELGRPFTITTRLEALMEAVDDVLERNVLGRGVKRVGGLLSRILGYLVAV